MPPVFKASELTRKNNEKQSCNQSKTFRRISGNPLNMFSRNIITTVKTGFITQLQQSNINTTYLVQIKKYYIKKRKSQDSDLLSYCSTSIFLPNCKLIFCSGKNDKNGKAMGNVHYLPENSDIFILEVLEDLNGN